MSADLGAALRPPGRPTKYRPEYADLVMSYMGQGYSLTAFAGHIQVSRECVYEWERAIPEFSDAVKAARAMRVNHLEGGLLSGDAAGPQITARIFALKNAAPEEWRDRYETENKTTHKFEGAKESLAAKLARVIDSGSEGEAG
jgi:hypothetical protein